MDEYILFSYKYGWILFSNVASTDWEILSRNCWLVKLTVYFSAITQMAPPTTQLQYPMAANTLPSSRTSSSSSRPANPAGQLWNGQQIPSTKSTAAAPAAALAAPPSAASSSSSRGAEAQGETLVWMVWTGVPAQGISSSIMAQHPQWYQRWVMWWLGGWVWRSRCL